MAGRDPRNWMWAEACELLDRAERLQREFFRPTPRAGRTAWQPPVDVFETAEDVWLLIALPGVPAERIQLRLDGATVVISGERPLPPPLRQASVHRLEIPHGRFERRVELPPGHYQPGEHQIAEGILVLRLQKLF